jgi:hypothetical protein
MEAKIEQAVKNYNRTGWGATVPAEDLEAVSDFIMAQLVSTGLSNQEAIRLVHLVQGGYWAKGWEIGYSSAKNHFSPSFSLTTEGYGSQEFRDEIQKSEA